LVQAERVSAIALPVRPAPASDAIPPPAQPTLIVPPTIPTLPPMAPPPPPTPEPALAPPVEPSEAKRIRVCDPSGRVRIARVYGVSQDEDRLCVILPDGQLGFATDQVETDEPFVPATAAQMAEELRVGKFARFRVRYAPHYLVVSDCSPGFAEASVKLLEDLYKGLSDALRRRDIPVHEAEFPLVAIIFRTEREFRAHKQVDPDIQAYYEVFTNRIYFYETSDRDQQAPEVAALRRPQTVAHEGTHQVLQNIGVHPRLSSWPLWLVEGLAEYCSSPKSTAKGATWAGLGLVNALHMATIRDLADPLTVQLKDAGRPLVGRDPRKPLVEYLVTRTRLTPTDYALAWALTHYLASRRLDEFLAYLRTMSRMPPLARSTPEDHLAAFRAAFKLNLAKMDKSIFTYLSKLKQYDPLPYYAVMFEQALGAGRVKRAALVSQSPSMIRQWFEAISAPQGGPPSWQVLPHSTRARALWTAEQWIQGQ
jgi:hypothetical protein